MNKQTLQEIINLTQKSIIRFWQLDPEFVINYFDKDIVWIGSVQSQFIEGYDEVVKDFRNIMKELKPCHISCQQFMVAQNSANACTITGRYFTTTDDEVGYFFQVQQRCTFVWELIRGEPKIKHCHISNPMGELKLAKGEKFANALGKMSKKYWIYRFNEAQDKKRIVVTDDNDVVHFLLFSEIMFVNAKGRNSIIHTTSNTLIFSRMSITEFMNKAEEHFSIIHRSYAINNVYISHIKPYQVVMKDGTQIPIPKRRYKEIRDKLIDIYSTKNK